MAVITATYTATLQTNPVMANHNGLSYSRGRANILVTSITDSFLVRIYVCKVPAGATIVNWNGVISGPTTRTNGAGTFILGLSTHEAGATDVTITHTMLTAETLSVSTVVGWFSATRAVEGYMREISVSDDKFVRSNYVTMTCTQASHSGTATVTFFADITVFYTMDDNVKAANLQTI